MCAHNNTVAVATYQIQLPPTQALPWMGQMVTGQLRTVTLTLTCVPKAASLLHVLTC